MMIAKESANKIQDELVMGTAADAHIRAFAVRSTNLVEEARQRHDTTPIMTAALGRLLSAGAMMGAMMKGDDDILTLQVRGDGPAKGLTVTADSKGHVKGYPVNPYVDLPLNDAGKLNVGGAIGHGTLSVIRDMGLKEPYNGVSDLVSGEIAEDLAYYFNISEQTPSAVGLGVLVNKDTSVKEAGGFIVQLMPDVPDDVVDALEKNINEIDSITGMMEKGMGPEEILGAILGDMGLEITEKRPVAFHCNCSKDRVSRALSAIGKKELDDIIDDGKPIEVKCHFCGQAYHFTVDELKTIREERLRDRFNVTDSVQQ